MQKCKGSCKLDFLCIHSLLCDNLVQCLYSCDTLRIHVTTLCTYVVKATYKSVYVQSFFKKFQSFSSHFLQCSKKFDGVFFHRGPHIIHLRHYPEAYSEPCQICKMEFFVKISQCLKAANYFNKELHLRYLTGF